MPAYERQVGPIAGWNVDEALAWSGSRRFAATVVSRAGSVKWLGENECRAGGGEPYLERSEWLG